MNHDEKVVDSVQSTKHYKRIKSSRDISASFLDDLWGAPFGHCNLVRPH